MRTALLLVVAATIAAAGTDAQAEIVVAISTSSVAAAPGEPLLVNVRVSSPSAEVVVPRLLRPPSHYLAFEIRDEKGKTYEFAGDLVRLRVDPRDVIRLGPDSSLEAHFDLVQLYGLSGAGSYHVTAIYGRPPTPRWRYVEPVRSNTITVRVENRSFGCKH